VDEDLADGVAAQLAGLCLDDDGWLRDYPLWNVAARGALLVDLARAGRLTDEPDGVMVDSTPTGFGPADRLLTAVTVEPEQSLDWWLAYGGVRMRDVADECVRQGRWEVHRSLLGRRYTDLSGTHEPDRQDPGTAAVLVLAMACGAFGPPEPVGEEELTPTGPLRWVCEAVTDHLRQTHVRNLGATTGGAF
jgi:hypothetical protein